MPESAPELQRFGPRPRVPTSITVGIPVRNGSAFIAAQLEALCAQTCTVPWDVVVVDNGSTDDTLAVVEGFKQRLALTVVCEPEPGICPARNAALAATSSDLLALCDADDIVQPGWIQAFVDAAPGSDQVGGYCDPRLASTHRAVEWRGLLSETELPTSLGRVHFAPGGNSVVWCNAARAIGGWDATFRSGADDVDFSLRLVAAGGRLGFARDAVLAYAYRDGYRDLMRQFYRYGRTEVLVAQRHPEMGFTSAGVRELWNAWWPVLRGVRSLQAEEIQRGRWLRELALRVGRLEGSIRARFLLP